MTIEWKPVISSNLAAVAYDPVKRLLYVRFVGDATYVYQDVPADIFAGFATAPSAGAYLAAKVKGRFPFSKVPPPQDTKMPPFQDTVHQTHHETQPQVTAEA